MITPSYYEYRIKAGESLSLIIAKFYSIGPRSHQYKKCIDGIMAINPHIKNPNMIKAGAILRLMPDLSSNVALGSHSPAIANRTSNIPPLLKRPSAASPAYGGDLILDSVAPEDEANFHLLSYLAARSENPMLGANALHGMFSGIVNPRINQILGEVNALYADYKAGRFTKGQYDYRRKLLLNEMKMRIGPMDKLLFGNNVNAAVRIVRGGGIPATHHISKHKAHINKLATLGKGGGYVLAGASLAAGCIQIGDTDSRQEKNEIFVETVTSTTTGVVAGTLLTIFLVSNPVGWGAALVLGAGSAALSYGLGKGAKKAYTASGSTVDLVSGLGIDKVCS